MKCPFCDGDCDKCIFMPIKKIEGGEREEPGEEAKDAMESVLKKEFDRDLYEWTMLDGRII